MQPQSSPTRLIPLSQGLWTLVDAADYEWLVIGPKWYALRDALTGAFYARRNIGNKPNRTGQSIHRLVMNPPDGVLVDHINMDSLDNRRCNLRLAPFQNTWNKRARSDNTSGGFKGVSWNSRDHKYQAAITASGRRTSLGYFADLIEAAHAYDAAARRLHGEFARLNFPDHA